jgi:GAF domain-containing protein
MDGHADIARALAESARAMHRPSTLDEVLDAIVHAARTSVPGIDEVSISAIHRDGRMETMAGTGPIVWEMDKLQYQLEEGPCVDTLRGKAEMTLGEDLRHREEWPRYAPSAAEGGVRAQMGLRLHTDRETLGGLNLYSTSSETLPDGVEDVAEPFAVHAAIALARARQLNQLNTAIGSRQLIGQAVGMVMERYQVPEDRAFQFLVRASSSSNIKLRDVAQQMVDQINNPPQDPS